MVEAFVVVLENPRFAGAVEVTPIPMPNEDVDGACGVDLSGCAEEDMLNAGREE